MVILERKSCKPMLAMSRPSITMLPDAASIILNSDMVKVDLPEPVLPTIPI